MRLGLPKEKEKQEYDVTSSEELTLYLHHSLDKVNPASWEIGLAKFLFFKRLILRNVSK